MLELGEAYGVVQQPQEPSRGASTRLVHEEAERLRVSAPPSVPLPPVQQPPLTVQLQPPAPRARQPAPAAPSPPDRWREMRKVLLYALVVALGLALHHVASDWLTRYIAGAYLTESSEQLAKLCYPASVAASIWVLRTWR